jgi:hypothetical protein
MSMASDDRLSESDEREIRRLVLSKGGLPARDWLVKERGYSPDRAKAIVDPFLDEAVVREVPAWDFFFAMAWLIVGLSLGLFAYLLGTSGYLFYITLAVAGFFCLRGLWKAARYYLAVRS